MINNFLKKGVVLVDKPKGMTSFEVVGNVCKKLGANRGGHAGTLDPNVTGLMLIALEEARKAMPVLMGMDKEYEGKMILHKDVGREEIENVFKKFTGEIIQKPPVKSRVARVERKRKVYSLKILKMEGREVIFHVRCEAGTYIRKLVHDIGQTIGCGAHMSELRRTKIGPFDISEAIPLSRINKKNVIPLEKILERIGLKKVVVKENVIKKIKHGQPLFIEDILKMDESETNEMLGIFDMKNHIIALGRNLNEKIKIERVFLV
jgi:H/ACA ribonucleoprotein complex subunit 4